MCSRIKSSFHGKIQEIPGVSVDNFESNNLNSRAFFLSHCHTDHTQGLFTKSLLDALKANNLFIYTSELSAAIIADDCHNDEALMRHIKPLKLGTSDLTLPKLNGLEVTFIKVTLIPAAHCLGSVMFLFETQNKTILYTGDFNISSNDIKYYASFHTENKNPIHIDTMYIDTTFIDKRYEYFPKRSVVIENMLDLIKKWLDSDDKNRISLNTSAKYGYEFVFNKIFEKLGLLVFVSEERWKFYRNYTNLIKGITNIEAETKIHACRDFQENGKHKFCSLTKIDDYNFLHIRLSAMKWDNYELDDDPIKQISKNRLDVCFPTHCSRTEILSFVGYFNPSRVIGFPNKYEVSNVRKINEISDVKPKKAKLDKRGTSNNKVDCNVLKKIFDI